MSKPAPTLSDNQLDQLLTELMNNRRLPQGVVWAGEFNDGKILNVCINNGLYNVNEYCILPTSERTEGRKWEIVQPLLIKLAGQN